MSDIDRSLRFQFPSSFFVCSSAKKMVFFIKEEGQSWTGDYFRKTILNEHVIPFLKYKENVLDPASLPP